MNRSKEKNAFMLQYTIIPFIWCEHRKLPTLEGFSPSENNLSIVTTSYSPHMKAVTVLLYQNYSEMFKAGIFWFVEGKNISSGIYIYIYTTSEKPVNDQSYGVLDRYGITILYK